MRTAIIFITLFIQCHLPIMQHKDIDQIDTNVLLYLHCIFIMSLFNGLDVRTYSLFFHYIRTCFHGIDEGDLE